MKINNALKLSVSLSLQTPQPCPWAEQGGTCAEVI